MAHGRSPGRFLMFFSKTRNIQRFCIKKTLRENQNTGKSACPTSDALDAAPSPMPQGAAVLQCSAASAEHCSDHCSDLSFSPPTKSPEVWS